MRVARTGSDRIVGRMSDHTHRHIERHCDVLVVGGSAAGLAAAVQIARQGHSVIVVDAGEPRNAPATHVHGFLGRDGTPPSEVLASGRAEVRSHGGEVLDGRVERVSGDVGDGFRAELTGGHVVVSRRVLAAAGLVDELPAIGGVADPSQQVPQAAADGARVGAMLCAALAEEDLAGATRPSASSADWDHRYDGAPMWSGNPNGSLVAEAAALAPGRALDVGAGEGADAIWLAEAGWEVTANDISQRALDRLRDEAERRGVHVRSLCADANAPRPFEPAAFDLVTAQYASIPRTADDRGVRNLIGAVAPGGTLLVVSHDLEPMRAPIDTSAQSRAFDPDAYVRVEDVAAVLEASPGWTVEVHERRPRPPGAASAAHHVDDVVLRARRVPT